MPSFIDIHHHILYGMDDGPSTFSNTQEMLDGAWRDGVCKIVATPHVTPGVKDLNIPLFLARIGEAQRYCDDRKIGIDVVPGAEIFYTEKTVDLLDEGRVPTLAGTRFVLIEFSIGSKYEDILNACDALIRSGYIPVLAHIERYPCFLFHLSRVYHLKMHLDVRLQINCSTIINGKFIAARFYKPLLNDGLIDAVASDAHNCNSRKVCMRMAYDILKSKYGMEYANSLTDGSMTINGYENLD